MIQRRVDVIRISELMPHGY